MTRDPLFRPQAWRLPLAAFLIIGVLGLLLTDRLLRRQYQEQAVTQAVQAKALLESYVRQRVTLVHGVSSMIETAVSTRGIEGRFNEYATRVFEDVPDLRSLYLSDANGVIQAAYPRTPRHMALLRSNMGAYDGLSPALGEALQMRRAVATGSVRLVDGDLGIVIVDPVVRGERVIGFVAGAVSYQAIFADALQGQLHGHFAYQVRDDKNVVVARSSDFSLPASIIRRTVSVLGGHEWRVEVAVPKAEPLVPRLLNWLIGSLLLVLVVLLVVREEAQSRRLAARTTDLELLSRDLLTANVRLEERAQQIAEANRAKSRFLANVSHELRTPLNAIVGYNSLARDGVYGELPDAVRGAHQRIGAAADHLLGLVNDVLDLSKIEVGRMAVELQPVDIRSLIDNVVTVLEPTADAKHVNLDILVARDIPRIMTDAGHVRQILFNLASNAIKFTSRGAVTLVAKKGPPENPAVVVIAVEDTGIGIAPDDLERIFQEFEQVRPDGRGDSLERGTGLGLTISRKLARLLGGELTVSSRLGAGSRFVLELPLRTPTPPASQDPITDTRANAPSDLSVTVPDGGEFVRAQSGVGASDASSEPRARS